MSRPALANAPKTRRGAFVQLVKDIVGVVPNIITFQYNPEKMTRSLTPWNPFAEGQSRRGAHAPDVQPYAPEEKISFQLVLDATDELEDGNVVAQVSGVASRIAALKKLTQPTEGLLSDIVAAAKALSGSGASEAQRPTVPVTLFVYGPGLILPVRVTTFSVDETFFSPTLFPLHATVSLELAVLSPDLFKCRKDVASDLAIAAFNFNKLQESTLALVNMAKDADEVLGVLPF
jgi:hypothetical protein